MPEKPPFLFRDVEGETLLLVEGIEDARFFSAILRRLKRDDVQIARVGGRNNFRPFLTSVLSKSENFSRLRRLGIVRDADLSAESTLRSLRDALDAAHLPAPSQAWEVAVGDRLHVSLAILPDGSSQGNLEDLCLRAIGNSPESMCVEQYVGCRVGAGSHIADHKISKTKVHAYLSVGKDGADPGLRLGEAAEAGVWDWEAPAFRQMVEFLHNL